MGRGVEGGEGGEEWLKRAFFLALAVATSERPAVTFVPVSGLPAPASTCDAAAAASAAASATDASSDAGAAAAGNSSAGAGAAAVMSVHATAWNLDRLRTEMWVRGQA